MLIGEGPYDRTTATTRNPAGLNQLAQDLPIDQGWTI